MHDIIFQSVFDGDLHSYLSSVEYSTSSREIITVGQAMNHYKLQMQLEYLKNNY